jgi:hypothetical protein
MARFLHYRFAVLALLTLASAGHAVAQQSPPGPGDRVRVTLTASAAERFGAKGWDAPLREAGTDSIALEPSNGSGPIVVARSDVARFERYAGHKSNAGKGAAIGLGLGAAAGGIAAFALSNAAGSCSDSFSDIACEDTAGTMGLLGAAAGGLIGLLLGAVSGAASSGDSWTSVDGPVQVTPTVIRGVPGIAMRVQF